MCDPVSIGFAVLSVATTGAGIYAQNKSVDAQDKAIRDQLANLEDEAEVTATAEVNDNLRAMRKEQARSRVAAGEAGLQLGSGSIEAILKDSLMQASLATSATKLNTEREVRSGRSEANSMLSRLQKDSALGAGLKLANAGVSGWNAGSNIQVTRNKIATSAGRS